MGTHNDDKLTSLLDMLRMKLNEQRQLTEQITNLYVQINQECGNLVTVPVEHRIKQKPTPWGPDKDYKPPIATPESQYLKDHMLTREL